MTQHCRAIRAFTLIELLIVVAIIAILAAIAVPNFLEAQTRAKVARVQGDMRTIAVAIEAYTVDFNKAPSTIARPPLINPINGWSAFGLTGSGTGYVSSRLTRLTTPVAYMSSVFRDGFINVNVGVARGPNDQPAQEYDTYDYINASNFITPPSDLRFTDASNRGASISSGALWHLVSAGPDMRNCFGGGNTASSGAVCGADYDPSNGSISTGDIVRIGGGPGPLTTLLPKYDRIQGKVNP